MQEEVEQRSLTLVVNSAKMTGRVFKAAISKYLARNREKRQGVRYCGKQTVRQLVRQNQGVTNVELGDQDIRDFERIARRYGVDYAIKKTKGAENKYLVFFKARDADALNAALTEYTQAKMRRQERPTLIDVLHNMKSLVPHLNLSKEKQRERSL